MSKRKNAELHKMNFIRGFRLSEAIEKNGISQAELLRQAKAQTDMYFDMSAPALNQIMKGKRPLRYEDAVVFADVLGVDVDYLMGKPGVVERHITEADKNADKYRHILSRIGSNIVAYETEENEDGNLHTVGYTVSYNVQPYDPEEAKDLLDKLISNGEIDESIGIALGSNFDAINVSVEEMESFYQDVCKFIQKRFDILITLNEEEA